MDRIARAAGVNKQLLFYYHGSKRGLFNAVLLDSGAELERALELAVPQGATPLQRLRAALHAQYDYFGRHPDLVSLLAQGTRSESTPFAPSLRRLIVLLAEGQGRGEVRGDVDPHLAAGQALTLMVGYLRLESLITASAPALGEGAALRARWIREATELFLRGVRTDDAQITAIPSSARPALPR